MSCAIFAGPKLILSGGATINGLAGNVLLSGDGNNIQAGVNGQTIIISGTGIAQQSDLTSTGQTLVALNLATSGALAAQISGSTAGVASLNSQVGNLSLASAGTNIDVSTSGSVIFISGFGIVQSGDLQATGQQAWTAANNNALNLSGNLTQTGVTLWNRDASISGGLEARIFATGAAAVSYSTSYSNGVGTNLSGNLTQTGVTLWDRDTSISGGLEARIFATGAAAISYANSVGTNLSGRLTATGALLSAVSVTGSAVLNSPNFTGLGGTLVIQSGNFILISGAGGTAASDHGDGINLSGNLTQTGVTLIALNLSTSGALIGQIQASAAGVTSVNGATGTVNISSAGTNIAISTSGSVIFVSGYDIVQSGDLQATGQQAWTAANNNALNLSGNLTQTGVTLWDRDASISGGLEARIFATGAAAVSYATSYANGIGSNLSGNLTQTGVTLWNRDASISGGLEVRIFASGAAAVSYANGIGVNLSGNLTQTGVTLWNRDASISGGLEARIFATGAAAVSYATSYSNGVGTNLSGQLTQTGTLLSAVSVTGSTIINSPVFSGMGGTLIIHSGNFVLVSGAAGGQGPGGGVSSLNGLTSDVTLVGENGLIATTVGQQISISGDPTFSSHGQILLNNAGTISGDSALNWSVTDRSLDIGTGTGPILPNNPINVWGSINSYIQINLQNRFSGTNAQADYVLTADNGTDTSNFVDLGINNQKFSNTGYQLYKPLDGFLYNRGGDMHLGTATSGNIVKVHVAGISSGNLLASFDTSGLNLFSGSGNGTPIESAYRLNGYPITAFTRGGAFYNADGIPSGTRVLPVWMAPYPCRATAVRGYIISGTNATINAFRNNTSADLMDQNMIINVTGAWVSTGSINAANAIFNTGDSLNLEVIQNLNNPVSISIQVEFLRI